jgi:predicted peroxiredoxin
MASKLLIVMANSDPDNATELGAPLLQATVAAAMEYEVEVVLTGSSGRLAIKGVAQGLIVQDHRQKTIYDYMKEAREAGVSFKICTPAIDAWGDDLIPEVEEIVGGAYVISEAMDDNTVTFTY